MVLITYESGRGLDIAPHVTDVHVTPCNRVDRLVTERMIPVAEVLTPIAFFAIGVRDTNRS